MSEAELLKELASLVFRARSIVEADANMMANLARHSPMPLEDQAKHDGTNYPSEIWMERFREIENLLEYYK